mgnify:CR=1 FL=1
MDFDFIIGHLNYWLFIVLMMTGLYIVIAKGNLVKKIVGLNIFQTAVFMFYISILTAIVVGIATTSLGLALVVRIHEAFGTIEEDDLLKIERDMATREYELHGSAMGGRA